MGKGNQASPPRWGSIYIHYFKFFCKVMCWLIDFSNHLYHLRAMGIYFILWVIKMLNYLFYCWNYSRFDHWDLSQVSSYIPLIHPYPFFSFKKKYCLTLWHYQLLYTHLVYFLFSPRISHFSKEPGSFYWKIVLETKIYALDVLTVSRVSLLPGPLIWHSQEIYDICVVTHIYTHQSFFLYLSVSIVN